MGVAMVADAAPWVVALSSDSEDDSRPPNRVAPGMKEVEQYISLDEDDDVQILNVANPAEELKGGEFVRMQLQDNSISKAGCPEVFRFAAYKESSNQHVAVVPLKQRKKNEARQQKRKRAALRSQERERNGDEIPLKSGEVPVRVDEGPQWRGVPSPTTGLGFIDMERLVTGSNTREWCHSLRICQGPELSNLHWNIVRFCETHELTAEQIDMRRLALEYVRQAVHEIWPCAEVHLFGSTATGLALPSSDIDVAVISPVQNGTWQKPSTRSWLSALSRHLKRQGQCRKIRQIPFAKVPLLKVVFNSGLACDISFDVANGIRGVPVIRHFVQHFEALRPLCLVLKFFLGQKKLNELFTGGIGSFCLINMVVSHLQNLGVSGSGHDLGVLLLSFLNHFSMMHDYRTDVVCTRPGYCAPKHVRGWVKGSNPELLSCEDPLDPTSDIAKGTYRILDVRKVFLKARTALLVHWHDEDILSELIDKSQPVPEPKWMDEPDRVDRTPASAPGGRKKSKKRKKKKRQQGVGSGDEEDSRPRKIRKLIAKSVQQVSDSSRRRPSAVHRLTKLQKRKQKQKVERIYLDFWGNHVNTKLRSTGKAARKKKLVN